MSISAHFQQVSSRREGRRTKTLVGRSLTCSNEESIGSLTRRAELGATSDVRDWHTKLREVLRCKVVQALIHRHAQFKGDTLRNVIHLSILPIGLAIIYYEYEIIRQDVVDICLELFNCLPAEKAIAIRKRNFLNKFCVSNNELCKIFTDGVKIKLATLLADI